MPATRFRTLAPIGLLALSASLAGGCAATPKLDETEAPVVFERPRAQVATAAIDALAVHGFDVDRQEPGYVQGTRPRKIGLFVGSGGESVGVWMDERGESTTEVRVQTARTVAGGLGQKDWDEPVIEEMRRALEP